MSMSIYDNFVDLVGALKDITINLVPKHRHFKFLAFQRIISVCILLPIAFMHL